MTGAVCLRGWWLFANGRGWFLVRGSMLAWFVAAGWWLLAAGWWLLAGGCEETGGVGLGGGALRVVCSMVGALLCGRLLLSGSDGWRYSRCGGGGACSRLAVLRLVVVGSWLFDVPLVWFAVGWFWLLVFSVAWFVLAVDGWAWFRCGVVCWFPGVGWIAGVGAWLLFDVSRCARFRGWLVGALFGSDGWRCYPGAGGGFGVGALCGFLSDFILVGVYW